MGKQKGAGMIEHSVAHNIITGQILAARSRSKTRVNAYLSIFKLFPWEEKDLEEMGYTLYYLGTEYVLCTITWEE